MASSPRRPRGTSIITVMQTPGPIRCGWCHRPVAQRPGPGRPRRYCRPSHRQRAYEARRRSDALAIPAGQVVVSETELRRVHDRLYQLEAALEDVEGDLVETDDPDRYRRAFDHLYRAVLDLAGMVVEPIRG